MKKTKGGIKMLHVIKDDFDESTEDILNSINNMLKKKEENKEKNNKEDNKE